MEKLKKKLIEYIEITCDNELHFTYMYINLNIL